MLSLKEQEYLLLINHSLFSTTLEGLSQLTGKPQSELEAVILENCQKKIASLDSEQRQFYLDKALEYLRQDYQDFLEPG